MHLECTHKILNLFAGESYKLHQEYQIVLADYVKPTY